jgi:hypothetical protein
MAITTETGMMARRAMSDIRDGWRMEERRGGMKVFSLTLTTYAKAPSRAHKICVHVRCAIVFLVMPVVVNNAIQVTSFFQWSR